MQGSKYSFFIGDPPGHDPGIYVLEDEVGKIYIGSAVDLQARLLFHDKAMRKAAGGGHDAHESQALQTAAQSGRRFAARVLLAFPAGVEDGLLRSVERTTISWYMGRGRSLYNDRIRGVRPHSVVNRNPRKEAAKQEQKEASKAWAKARKESRQGRSGSDPSLLKGDQ